MENNEVMRVSGRWCSQHMIELYQYYDYIMVYSLVLLLMFGNVII